MSSRLFPKVSSSRFPPTNPWCLGCDKNDVALNTACLVIVPLYRPTLDEWEKKSLRSLGLAFDSRPIAFFGPTGMRNAAAEKLVGSREWTYFPRWFFKSAYHYSWLVLSERFYSKFLDYDYILIYQTDAFVFRDDLDGWIEAGFSYVGAPCRTRKLFGDRGYWVGNGGLSLRRVRDCVRVLRVGARRCLEGPLPPIPFRVPGGVGTLFLKLRLIMENHEFFPPSARGFVRRWSGVEDVFFGHVAPRIDQAFRVPAADLAARFALDEYPEFFSKAFGLEHEPMGFHGLGRDNGARWNPAFWAASVERTLRGR